MTRDLRARFFERHPRGRAGYADLEHGDTAGEVRFGNRRTVLREALSEAPNQGRGGFTADACDWNFRRAAASKNGLQVLGRETRGHDASVGQYLPPRVADDDSVRMQARGLG